MLISQDVYKLFNPYHDKLGRFATKQGGISVTAGVKSWLDKPVATIGGRTITRKGAIAAVGAVAAAALAAGAVVYVTKGRKGPEILGKIDTYVGYGDIQSGGRVAVPVGDVEQVQSVARRKIEQLGKTFDRVTRHVRRLDPEIEGGGKKLVVARDDWEWTKIWGGPGEPEAFVSGTNGDIYVSPQLINRDIGTQSHVLIHEQLHGRSRWWFKKWAEGNWKLKAPGNLSYRDAPWIEEGLNESLANSIAPYKSSVAYDEWVHHMQAAIRRVAKGNPKAGFDITNEMHKFNSTVVSLHDYLTDSGGLQRTLGRHGVGYTMSDVRDFKDVFFRNIGVKSPPPRDEFEFVRSAIAYSTMSDREFADWMSEMRLYAFREYMNFSDVGGVGAAVIIEESERRVVDRFGTIYVPEDVVADNLKRLEDEQRSRDKEEVPEPVQGGD